MQASHGQEQSLDATSFRAALEQHGCKPLLRGAIHTLQVNLGKRCNQACHHCHVEAGPNRREAMEPATARRVLELLERSPDVSTLDMTGGAPELAAVFRPLVQGAAALGRQLIDRCNLTVLLEPGQEDTAQLLAAHAVKVVASLPCYRPENVERQRGRGVFQKSIDALWALNELGYAAPGSPLELDLVYNPLGPSLPPPQQELEQRYREELGRQFGIRFNRLLCLTNMPIKRFADALAREGRTAEYQGLLVNHFNPATLPGLMCRSLVSVGYQGELYDCDFNQMLELPLAGRRRTIFEIESIGELAGLEIATGSHCFGCTAGSGSSCGGALA